MRIQKSKSKGNVTSTVDYGTAITHIMAAIDVLGKDAKSDIVAKESIANLSVVLFDLKSK